MYRESFPSKLKHAREKSGLTQREVAAETGINQSAIARYETGVLEPDIEKLGTLADFYGLDLNWLVGTKGIHMHDLTAIKSRNDILKDMQKDVERENRKSKKTNK